MPYCPGEVFWHSFPVLHAMSREIRLCGTNHWLWQIPLAAPQSSRSQYGDVGDPTHPPLPWCLQWCSLPSGISDGRSLQELSFELQGRRQPGQYQAPAAALQCHSALGNRSETPQLCLLHHRLLPSQPPHVCKFIQIGRAQIYPRFQI